MDFDNRRMDSVTGAKESTEAHQIARFLDFFSPYRNRVGEKNQEIVERFKTLFPFRA